MTGPVLLTGAQGYIGRHVLEYLTEARLRVRTIARVGEIPIVTGAGSSALIHLAGVSGRTQGTPAICSEARDFARRVIRFANDQGVPMAVLASSVYASVTEQGQPSEYGLHKLEIEEIFKTEFVGRLIVLRLPPVYGGEDDKSAVAKLAGFIRRQLPLPLGQARAPRSYLCVENLLELILVLLKSEHADDFATSVYEPSDGPPVTTEQLVHLLNQVLGKRSALLPIPPSVMGVLGLLAGRTELVRAAFSPLLATGNPKLAADFGWTPSMTMPVSLEYLKPVS